MFKYRVDTLISREDIAIRVKELANEINKDFEGEEVLFVGLLRGSVVFLADLGREIEVEATMDFMTVSSYGNSTESSRDVKIIKDLEEDIRGRNVIIVEDIVDTGFTLRKVEDILMTREPKKLKIVTLLDKPERREVEIDVEYIGFKIQDDFVVGYGIDFAQKHRTLPYVGIVVREEE